ncbi:hypothetical protein [Microbacterium oleivorans]|uniref:Uncharacterized protein n=1 Tax=Microbacterium oleivorans TaxID=273677 RepID=A0A7D5EWY3_9MICO|nr:hypothetical protein [Microbacterium oleivorans]QLD10868.1 hypothetical protein HW566_03170 [Microbacterium oleivorans]
MVMMTAGQLSHDCLGKTFTRTDASGNKTSGLLESLSIGSFGVSAQYGEYTVRLQPDESVDVS